MDEASKLCAEWRQVDGVEVIILVDNMIDLMTSISRPEVKRTWWFTEGRAEEKSTKPLAEHGFAALVRVKAGGERHAVLFDAGASGRVALHNAKCFDLDWNEVEAIALSHGHRDHTGGLPPILARIGRRQIPLIMHEDMFVPRGALDDKGRVTPAPPPLSRQELTALGAKLILNQETYSLFDGALLVLGEIPRQADFEGQNPGQVRREGSNWMPDPWTWDDRGLILSVRDEGLVILTGCAHAGIVNTVLYARTIAGCQPIRAIIGGFHLAGSRFEPRISRTVSEIKALDPDLVIPLHCTGPRGAQAFVHALPEATVLGGALMRIRLGEWKD